MEIGQIIVTTHINQVLSDATLGWKSDRDKYFVFLLMGQVKRDGSEVFDSEKVLNDLGWIKDESMWESEQPEEPEGDQTNQVE